MCAGERRAANRGEATDDRDDQDALRSLAALRSLEPSRNRNAHVEPRVLQALRSDESSHTIAPPWHPLAAELSRGDP
jgi:hypothetical protein